MKIKVEDLICLALRDSVLTNLSHLYERVFAEAKERESFLEVFFLKKDEYSPLNRGLQKKKNPNKTKKQHTDNHKIFGGKKRKENFKIFSPIFTWSSPVIFSGLKYY